MNMTISQVTVCLGFLKAFKKMDLPVSWGIHSGFEKTVDKCPQ